MAQIPYRANVTPSVFPLLSQLEGRSVIVPQGDHTYVPGVNPPHNAAVADMGIPQIYYGHNIFPSTYGVQSVSYKEILGGGTLPGGFSSVELIQTEDGFRTYIGWRDNGDGQGDVYLLDEDREWVHIIGPVTITTEDPLSVGTVDGVTYIYLANTGCWTVNWASQTATSVNLDGLDESEIRFICAASGYLLAFGDSFGVAWSATTSPTDFVPSLTTGAGGAKLQQAEGRLVCAVSTSLGCIIYTVNNAISCTFSGNVRYPFNFLPINAAGGIASKQLATKESVNGAQYAYTTNGLQQISHAGAKTILPNITDFVAGSLYEYFDTTTNQFVVIHLDKVMRKKLALVSDRYLLLSYGIDALTDAIVVDVVTQRMGRLRFQHTDVFELQTFDPESLETPRSSIALLTENGYGYLVNLDITEPAEDSVLILGRYQLQHSHWLHLNEVELENIQVGAEFECRALTSWDGKSISQVSEGFLVPGNGLVKDFLFDVVGVNHSIVLIGSFNIISLVLWSTNHGEL